MRQTHRERYPEQYEHPLVGRRVRVPGTNVEGVVERVVDTRFGKLAVIGGTNAWPVQKCEVVVP